MGKMINLEKFAGGALSEKFNVAFQDVIKNIADPNTSHKAKRKLVVELIFEPTEDRELSMVGIHTKTTLAQPKGVGTRIMIDSDGEGGIIASEYNNQIKGQQYMVVDQETGEILDKNDLEKSGIKLVK